MSEENTRLIVLYRKQAKGYDQSDDGRSAQARCHLLYEGYHSPQLLRELMEAGRTGSPLK